MQCLQWNKVYTLEQISRGYDNCKNSTPLIKNWKKKKWGIRTKENAHILLIFPHNAIFILSHPFIYFIYFFLFNILSISSKRENLSLFCALLHIDFVSYNISRVLLKNLHFSFGVEVEKNFFTKCIGEQFFIESIK